MRRRTIRRAVLALGGFLGMGGLILGLSGVATRAEESPAAETGARAGSAEETGRESANEIKLYQLLYDYHFTEPLTTVGQKVRILIWLRYLELSHGQKQLLLSLARRFDERRKAVDQEQTAIIQKYEAQLEPIYQQIYQAVSVPNPDEQALDAFAQELQSANLTYKREDELHTLRIQMVRAVLSEARDFLNTLSPEQEERLVTSLFFLRRQLDPFANPGDYRSIIGPTWNAGDFSPLLKNKSRRESHLNIGGLWGMDGDSEEKSDYANIQRSIVMFFVLKEPVLIAALEESLAQAQAAK